MTASNAPPPALRLQDPNEISRVTAWDLDFRQLEPGDGDTLLRGHADESSDLMQVRFPHGVHQVGAGPAGRVAFGLPRPGRVASWLGAEAPAAPIIAFGRGQAFDGVSRAGFEAVALSFDEAWFMELAERIGLRMPAQALAPGAVRTPGLPGASRRVAARAERMLSRPGPAPARADKEALAFDLIRSLGAPDEGPDALAPGLRGRALRRALEAMDADLDAELTVADVCALSGASWRTLNRAFLERFGMGPKAYLRGLRLSRARSDLIAADPQVKVADVANRWGFWHMGQFAADYRKLFGALPSEHARR